MAFPFSIKGVITANKFSSAQHAMTEDEVVHFILNNLAIYKADLVEQQDNHLHLISTKSMFNFKYQLNLKVEKKQYVTISYEYRVAEIFNISLILAIFVALFSRLSFAGFLSFSFIVIFLFYLINIWFIATSLKAWIKEIPVFKDSVFDDVQRYGGEQEIKEHQNTASQSSYKDATVKYHIDYRPDA